MRNPICLIRTIWYSLITLAPVSGHNFKTSDTHTPPNVHMLECQTCGEVSISWSWHSLEEYK